MSDPVTVNIDLGTLSVEAQSAFTPSIADAFLEHAVMADKRKLKIDATEFAGDPTTQFLITEGYVRVDGPEIDGVISLEVTEAGIERGAEVVESKRPKL